MEAVDRLLMFQQYMSKEIGGINKFEVHCGLSMGCLANAAKNNRSISTRTVCKIKEKFPKLNMNWVIAGDGDMIICDGCLDNMNYKAAYEECLSAIESLNNVIKTMKTMKK